MINLIQQKIKENNEREKTMKKLSLLIALALLVTVGGVYATWVYSQSSDVADITSASSLVMTEATFTGTDGTYKVDATGLTLEIDPKEGTTHVTSLKVGGKIVITFTPNAYAPDEVKKNGVASTYEFTIGGSGNSFDDGKGAQPIVTLTHPGEKHDIVWTDNGDGTFSYTMDAATFSSHVNLTEFTLDTKADYDKYDEALLGVQIVIHVSDGKTTSAS